MAKSEARQAQARVIMLHKIINNLVYIDTNQYIEPAVVRGEEVVRFIITYEAFRHTSTASSQ